MLLTTYSESKSSMSANFYRIRFYEDVIGTTVTSSASAVDVWISEVYRIHRRCFKKNLVGLDIEWRPNLEPNANNPAATIQICIDQRCLIFQFLHADGIPASLADFLGNDDFVFVGVGVKEDAKKLLKDHKLRVGNTLDVAEGAAKIFKNPDLAWRGLKRLAFELIGKVMEKPKKVTLSPWDAKCLSYPQVEYASIDAFVSFLLGLQVFRKDEPLIPFPIESEFTANTAVNYNRFTQYNTASSTVVPVSKMCHNKFGFIPYTRYIYCGVPAGAAVAYSPQLAPSFWSPNRPPFPSDLNAVGYPLIPMLPSTRIIRYPNMARLP